MRTGLLGAAGVCGPHWGQASVVMGGAGRIPTDVQLEAPGSWSTSGQGCRWRVGLGVGGGEVGVKWVRSEDFIPSIRHRRRLCL